MIMPRLVTALARVLRLHGIPVHTWTSALDFLGAHDSAIPGCLVTDVRMPGMDGFGLQQALLARGVRRPIVFMTGEGDIPTAVQAMRAGAVTFLSKPVSSVDLLDAVREAFIRDASARSQDKEREVISHRLATLTSRERQILDLLVTGLMNKQIANELRISEKTVKAHRGRVIEKMQVSNAAALISLLSRAESSQCGCLPRASVSGRPEALSRESPAALATP